MNAECIEHGQKNHTALSKYALLFGSLQTVDTPQSVHISSFHWGFSSCIAHTCSQHFSPTHTHTPCYSLMLLSNSIPTVPPVHKTVRDQFCCSDTGNCRRLLKVDNQSMEKKTWRETVISDQVNICQLSPSTGWRLKCISVCYRRGAPRWRWLPGRGEKGGE